MENEYPYYGYDTTYNRDSSLFGNNNGNKTVIRDDDLVAIVFFYIFVVFGIAGGCICTAVVYLCNRSTTNLIVHKCLCCGCFDKDGAISAKVSNIHYKHNSSDGSDGESDGESDESAEVLDIEHIDDITF